VVLIFSGGLDSEGKRGVDAEIESAYEHAAAKNKPMFAFFPAETKNRSTPHMIVRSGKGFESPTQLATDVATTLRNWRAIQTQRRNAPEAFQIAFAPQLSEAQVAASLEALADYYRACGGVGLESDIELVDVLVEAPVDVLA
jgi:hypothetical protein